MTSASVSGIRGRTRSRIGRRSTPGLAAARRDTFVDRQRRHADGRRHRCPARGTPAVRCAGHDGRRASAGQHEVRRRPRRPRRERRGIHETRIDGTLVPLRRCPGGRSRGICSLPPGVPAESTSQLYPSLIAERRGSIRACVCRTEFFDIGTPDDYLRTSLLLTERETGAVERGERPRVDRDVACRGFDPVGRCGGRSADRRFAAASSPTACACRRCLVDRRQRCGVQTTVAPVKR